MSTVKKSLFDKYLDQLAMANAVLKLDEQIYERLRVPALLVKGHVRVQMDNGSFREFQAYRCQHNHARGPTQGGTRFDLEVCESEVKGLAAFMTMKNAIVGILHGGGKGGICVDKFKLSTRELELLCRGYICLIARWIGPRKDGPAPDVNTGGQEMAWFLDQFERMTGEHCFAAFTGKPLSLGGSFVREDATALGAVFATKAAMKDLGMGPSQKRVAIDGFGNAGYHFARLMSSSEYGSHKIVSVSDRSGMIANANGLDCKKIHDFCCDQTGKKVRKVCEYDGDVVRGDEAMKIVMEADVFAPAAFEDRVTADMVEKSKWRLVVELANGPLTQEADRIAADRKIVVIPDIFASGGGVRVSAAEKIQGLENQRWPAARVKDWLKDRMELSYDIIEGTREKYNLKTLREAAVVYAIGEVAEAMVLRGGLHIKEEYEKVVDAGTVIMYQDGLSY